MFVTSVDVCLFLYVERCQVRWKSKRFKYSSFKDLFKYLESQELTYREIIDRTVFLVALNFFHQSQYFIGLGSFCSRNFLE